jgi:uncharacterized membrane protein
MIFRSIFYNSKKEMLTRICIYWCIIFAVAMVMNDLTAEAQQIDGKVTKGEYKHSLSFSKGAYVLYWTRTSGKVYFAIIADTTGWVAIGFDPVVVMDNADLVFGWVDDSGKAKVIDCHSQGAYGPYPPDEKLGGTDDILQYGGSESEGRTTIEFSRFLNTGDRYDSVLWPRPGGGNKIIWIYGASDDYTQRYENLGYASLQDEQKSAKDFLHLIFVFLGLVFLSSNILTSRNLRKRKFWPVLHRFLETLGVLFGITGAVLGLLSLSEKQAGLKIFYPWLAYLSIAVFVFLGVAGYINYFGRIHRKPEKEGDKTRGMVYTWLNYIALMLLLVMLFLGIVS